MGLPMYRDPDDEEADVFEAAAKLDRAAAARRSSIRREPSVRPRDALTTSQSLARLIRDRRRRTSQSQDRTDTRIARLQAELETLRRIRLNRPDSPAQDQTRQNTTSRSGDNLADSNENEDSGLEEDMEPSSADIVRQHLPRPSRESNLRFEVLASSASGPSSPWQYRALPRASIPSPPYSSDSGRRDRSIPDGPLLDDNSMPALTEGFAPARVASTDSPYGGDRSDDEAQLETPPPDESYHLSLYPPLRRIGRTSPRPLHTADGLGDRQRSPTPRYPAFSPTFRPTFRPTFPHALEEGTWATLLTEMHTPRDSTTTSFASTASDSHQRSSRNSQNVSTSFGEIGMGDDTCDLDLPPGITEDDVLEMRARHRPRESDRMTGRRGLQEHQDRIGSHAEMGMFRAILGRMHRREDIPDDWWATVGLSPDFGRTLD